jgi:mono/diheme cytochrome c family protein
MPAWGEEGGGPLTTQQIDELIAYLESLQISSDAAKDEVAAALRSDLGLEEDAEIDYSDPAVGEALFNLGLADGTAGGAYSCARCHTKGASFADGETIPADADLSEHAGFEDGSGAFGFSLTSSIIPRQFLNLDELIEFLNKGSEFGMLYGQRGQGSGRMPGFGDNPNTEDEADGMFTEEMLEAVACYEASLGGERASGCPALAEGTDDDEDGATTTSTTTSSTTSTTAPTGGTTTTTQES